MLRTKHGGAKANQVHSCSLACFKAHQPTHEADDADDQDVKIKLEHLSSEPNGPSPGEQQEPKQPINPYLALQAHPQFQRLFTTYPTLKSQLQRVHKMTMNPYDEPRSHDRGGYRGRGRGRGGRGGREPERVQGQWTQDKADDLAAKMLVDLVKQDAGVREFMELVGHVSKPGGKVKEEEG